MKALHFSVVALTGAIALLSTPVLAQQVIRSPNGQCVGVSEVDGVSLVLISCSNPGSALGLTVTYGGPGPLRGTTTDGRSGCVDAYRGDGGRVEFVGCDGTAEQNWDLSVTFQNAGMRTCITGRNGGVYNAGCGADRRQGFSLGVTTLPGVATAPAAGSFGSGVATTAPVAAPTVLDPAGVISHNGGAVLPSGAGGLVGNSGNTMVAAGGGNMVAAGGGNMVAAGAGNMVAAGAGNLIGLDGGSMVAAGGGNATGGYSLQSAGGQSFQYRVGSLCLDASGSEATVQDCATASRFSTSGDRLQVAGTSRCVDGWRGQYKVGREEDQSVREPVKVENCDGTAEQTWGSLDVQAGGFLVQNLRYPLCMDVDGGVIQPGRAVLLWQCYGSFRPANQVFSPIATGGAAGAAPAPVYAAPAVAGQRIAVGSLCLDASGSEVILGNCDSATRFDLSGGLLKVAGSSRCVDGWRGQHKVGREEDQSARESVRVENCDGTAEQTWIQHASSGGTFFLKDARYGLCMDVDGGVIQSGRGVLLWLCYDAFRPQNQIFTILN